MSEIRSLKDKLPEIRKYVIEVLEKNADRSIYTTIGRLYRVEKHIQTIMTEESVTDAEKDMIFLAFYVLTIDLSSSAINFSNIEKSEKQGLNVCKKISKKFSLEDKVAEKLYAIAKESLPHKPAILIETKIIKDSYLMEFAGKHGRKHIKQRYEEMVLRDFDLGLANWYDTVIALVSQLTAFTTYGKKHVEPGLEKLNNKLRKEKKDLESRTSLLLKKELNISDLEIKKLKKDINKAKQRDERGIQTLFKTTIKNHYTLNEMVDKKASIMITVNSIILSLIMGGQIGKTEEITIAVLPILGLSLASIMSIVFAVVAIRPIMTQGDFTEEEIRNKEGNLLYFGNFHNMHFRDFEWAFLQMLSDKNHLYGSMIRDYYYQGIGLSRKYRYIRYSLTIFLFGFGITFIGFFLTRFIAN